MNVETTFIQDLVVLTPDVFEDSRGYFFEGYNKNKLSALGIDIEFVQDNQSFSQRGPCEACIIRILPMRKPSWSSVLQGEIMDVASGFAKRFPNLRTAFYYKIKFRK